MLTLYEYLNEAKKLLLTHKFSYINDDSISYVAGYMMKADSEYDGKTGTIEGFRNKYGKYGMYNYANRERKKTTDAVQSLFYKDNSGKMNTHDISYDDDSPDKLFEITEIFEYIDTLPEKQKECLKMYYYDGKSMNEISSLMNITKQMVSSNIKKGIRKLKTKFKE